MVSVFNNKWVEIIGIEVWNEVFGENYFWQYEMWKEMVKIDFKSEFNGNEVVDVFEQCFEMVVLWVGYVFLKDYLILWGYMYVIEDIIYLFCIGVLMDDKSGLQFFICWICKSLDVFCMMEVIGVDLFYNNKWGVFGSEIVNLIGCVDCYELINMKLYISCLVL